MRARILLAFAPAVLLSILAGSVSGASAVFEDGVLSLDVPVQVITIGFTDEARQELTERLEPMQVGSASHDFNQLLPIVPEEGLEGNDPSSGHYKRSPLLPRAVFDVRAASPSVAEDLSDELEGWRLPDPPGLATPLPIYDGSALESWLADRLVAEGFSLEAATPGVVVLDSVALGMDFHRWRYFLPTAPIDSRFGYLGEREPFGIVDLGHDDMQVTAEYLQDAVRYRILQGAIYRPSLRPCHALTLVVGVEASPEVEGLLDPRAAEDLFDADAIRAAFQEVTGNPDVFVDTTLLSLPLDDPILDAMARGEYQTLEAQRWWLDENWERYWVEHEGCEAYVSFLVYRENTPGARIVSGIAVWDESKSARMSFSWDSETLGAARPTPETYNFVRYLLTHETGHLFGLRHPHDVTDERGCIGSNSRYSTIWSAMSYETGEGSVGFSAMDRNNLQRNRAAYMLGAAAARGLEGTPAWDEAMEHISAYRWLEAGDALSEDVNAIELPVPVGPQPPPSC